MDRPLLPGDALPESWPLEVTGVAIVPSDKAPLSARDSTDKIAGATLHYFGGILWQPEGAGLQKPHNFEQKADCPPATRSPVLPEQT